MADALRHKTGGPGFDSRWGPSSGLILMSLGGSGRSLTEMTIKEADNSMTTHCAECQSKDGSPTFHPSL